LITAHKILNLVSSSKYPSKNTSELKERLSIAFQTYDALLWEITQDFMIEHPDVNFNIYGNTMAAPFADSNYDFVIGRTPTTDENINHIFLTKHHFFVVLPDSHPLVKKESIYISDLKDDYFCFMQSENGNLESSYQLCVDSGFIPKCTMITNNAYYKFQFVSKSPICAIIPVGWKRTYDTIPNKKIFPLRSFSTKDDIYLSWTNNILSSPIAVEYLEYLKDRIPKAFDGSVY